MNARGTIATPLLKAAPERQQLADRLGDGHWRGIEICLAGKHVAHDQAVARAVEVTRAAVSGTAVTAEAPVSWPSGAFVRVDRLDEEAREGIERSAEFAAGIGSPVLTIHLFVPQAPDEFRVAGGPSDEDVERFLRFYADACLRCGVTPLIENVPPVLRMRTGGLYLSAIGGHWRDLVVWRARVPALRFTLDTSHAALFRSFCAAYPTLFGLASDEGLDLARYVEELGPATEVAHVSDAHGLLGEGLPYGAGELDLDPVVRSLGRLVRFIVAEINEPDPRRSHDMKAGYRAIADARPDVIFHLAAYKHVDWAETFPEEFVDTNLQGSWNVLRAADSVGVETVVVASTDKAALAASFYGRTKRLMEQLAAYAARRGGGQRSSVRFVNVLASAGSVSELFLSQVRARIPLTVTDTGMLRYWITMAHGVSLGAQAALLASERVSLATASDPVLLTVGELARRIWRQVGREGEPELEVLGIRPGETLSEVLTGPGETLGEERFQGIAPIAGEIPLAAPAWVAERLPERGAREEVRAVWLEAIRRPGLISPKVGGTLADE